MIFKDSNQVNQALPAKGRLMALDLGTKRIGIALSDETRFIATPKLVLNRHSNQVDFVKIKNFFDENQAVAIIIGRPINMDGQTTEMTNFAENFAKNFDEFLEEKFPIFLFEERLTSFEAKTFYTSDKSRRRNVAIDDIAASLILQHFLDDLSNHL